MNKIFFPLLGSFVKLKSPDYLLGAVAEAKSYASRAFMFFFGAPLSFLAIDKKKLNKEEFLSALTNSDIDLANICVHLPYLINLGNCQNFSTLKKSLLLLEKNLSLGRFLGIKKMILHPGSALQADRTKSLKQVGVMLTQVLKKFPQVEICLETMAGSGSQLGKTFEELKMIIDNCQYPDQINICFDLCHLYAAGYDIVHNWQKVLDNFDQIIGLKKLKVIHINDSKKPFASHLDRHANVGDGEIGFGAIQKIVWDPHLTHVPMILETPYDLNNKPLYKKEIAMLLQKPPKHAKKD